MGVWGCCWISVSSDVVVVLCSLMNSVCLVLLRLRAGSVVAESAECSPEDCCVASAVVVPSYAG